MPATYGVARQVLQVLAAQLEHIEAAIAAVEKQLMAWHKANAVSQRLASIPGIGPIIATAIATTVADPNVFRSGREFAAWLGLVPRQNSTGGKTRLGGITKRGNRYLRRLLINGASANLLRSKATKADPWVIGIRRRRPPLVVAVALANKLRGFQRTYVRRVRLIQQHGEFAEHGIRLRDPGDLNAFLYDRDFALLKDQELAACRGGPEHGLAGLVGYERKDGELPLENGDVRNEGHGYVRSSTLNRKRSCFISCTDS